jgi:hypothetical protein
MKKFVAFAFLLECWFVPSLSASVGLSPPFSVAPSSSSPATPNPSGGGEDGESDEGSFLDEDEMEAIMREYELGPGGRRSGVPVEDLSSSEFDDAVGRLIAESEEMQSQWEG